MEWDFCQSDCPSEEPEILCIDDPMFPKLHWEVDYSYANYTTDYEPNPLMPSREV